jgi:FtsH-binding integral membrane protein
MEEKMDYRYSPNEHAVPQVSTEASTIFLAKVFYWMAIGLGLTGVTAFITVNSQTALQLLFSVQDGYAKPNMLLYGLLIGELGMVFYLSARIQKISAQAATGIFIGYSILNGITLSTILLFYTMSSVALTFFVTSGMFGAMAVYGFVTKRDLTSWGSFLFMGLIGIIIAMFANFFFQSPMMSWVISGIGVIIFTGLTAYDVQQITRMGEQGILDGGEAVIRKGAIMGALKLYLDFINLFLMLLRFLGDRR